MTRAGDRTSETHDRSTAAIRLVGVATFGLLATLGCGRGQSSGTVEPTPGPLDTPIAHAATVTSAEPSGAVSGAPVASAAASEEPEPAPPPLPSVRPSTTTLRPPSVNKEQWKRVFDTYGHLLDIDFRLDELHRQYPTKTRLYSLATTHEGRRVTAMMIADRPAKATSRPSMLLNGAHHGDEPLSSDIVLDAIETMLAKSDSDPKIQRYLSELQIWCVPMVNPDGFATFMADFGAGRKNGRETRKVPRAGTLNQKGVDLNRNYPFKWGSLREEGSTRNPERRNYRGPEPGSEPETKGMMALSEAQHFVGSISYHIGTVALLAPYTVDHVPPPAPNEAWLVAEDIVRGVNPDKLKKLYVRQKLYPVDGADQDYFRGTQGTVALLFESAHRSWETPVPRQDSLDAMRPAWGILFDRYLDGPSVEGRVKDESGAPVSAEVRIVEVQTNAGEVWKSRCPDGFFGRYLPGFGKYTVRVVPDGGAPIDKVIEVATGSGRAKVEIVVPAGRGACGGSAK